MFPNGEWQPPEPKTDIAAKVEMIDRQIGELSPQWEEAQDRVDLTRRLARLWEERFALEGDAESFNGAFYFYQHINKILVGSDPLIVRKLKDLKLKQLDLHIKPLEDWMASWGSGEDEEAVMASKQLADLKKTKAELLANEEMLHVLFGGKGAQPRAQFW
jgi:hypothetical protein